MMPETSSNRRAKEVLRSLDAESAGRKAADAEKPGGVAQGEG